MRRSRSRPPNTRPGQGINSASVAESGCASSVTSWPRALNPRASISMIRSIPPYRRGGTGSSGSAVKRIRMRSGANARAGFLGRRTSSMRCPTAVLDRGHAFVAEPVGDTTKAGCRHDQLARRFLVLYGIHIGKPVQDSVCAAGQPSVQAADAIEFHSFLCVNLEQNAPS